MNRTISLITIIGLATPAARAAADIEPVGQWNVVTLEAVRDQSALAQIRVLAMVHAAMFDAANGVEPRFQWYVADLRAEGPASAPAALAAAAHTVLTGLVPTKRAAFDVALIGSLSGLSAGGPRDAGLAFGRRVGEIVLARRRDDGAVATRTYQPPAAAGVWRPTPPGQLPPLAPHWGTLRPFLIDEPSRFAPPAPPALNSERYARELAEVKSLGARNSARRTPDQTAAAVFWTGFAPGLWSSAARQALTHHPELSLVERARVFALMSGAMADASIVGWAAKYRHGLWRPITAIRLAAEDGNDATEADPAWEPIIVTPPFPCYVSGHAIFAGAAERVLGLTLGDAPVDLQITNSDVGLTRRFAGFTPMAEEVREVRIWSGVHFRASQEAGLASGRKIGEASVASRLLPLGERRQRRTLTLSK